MTALTIAPNKECITGLVHSLAPLWNKKLARTGATIMENDAGPPAEQRQRSMP